MNLQFHKHFLTRKKEFVLISHVNPNFLCALWKKKLAMFFPTLHGYLAEHAYRVSDMDTYPIHVRYVSNKYPIFIN